MAVATRSAFVTGMGWLSFALGVMGVATGLLQAALLPAMPLAPMVQQAFAMLDAPMPMPVALQWLLRHLQLLNAASLLASALFARVSWGLVQRREWARRGFIAFLGFGVLASFAGVALFQHLLDWATGAYALAGADPDPLSAQLRAVMRALVYASVALLAALHGAIAWALCTPAIRAEFD